MKFTIQKKYLTLPVNPNLTEKKVCLWEEGRLLFDFDCKIDLKSPCFTAYVDVSRFMGRTVELTVSPEMEVSVDFANEMTLEGLYEEPLRPKVHFTVKNGYNNDPNGLIYREGVYHMFFQHNPCAPQWGNMHWGHAVSTDLLHWEELDCALFPDEFGTMYSGSAIEDTENRSGLAEGETSPMLLFYTAAGGRNLLSVGNPHTQCLAYSTDGVHFQKYNANPVVPHAMESNRDPKVVWVEELGKFLMALYLKEDLYRFYASEDLLTWSVFQDIHIKGDRECPDFYSLLCEGEKKWVLSGASDLYLVGHFEQGAFVIEGEEKRLTYSRVSYAAQSFSGIADRRVRICWHRNSTLHPSPRFSQQMGIPTEMALRRLNGSCYLSALPIRELATLRDRHYFAEREDLQKPVRLEVGANPLDIVLQMPYIPDAEIVLSVFGVPIILNTRENQITVANVKMPISVTRERIDLRMIVDTCSMELFADEGRFCCSLICAADGNLPYVELSCGEDSCPARLDCYTLRSIHSVEP